MDFATKIDRPPLNCLVPQSRLRKVTMGVDDVQAWHASHPIAALLSSCRLTQPQTRVRIYPEGTISAQMHSIHHHEGFQWEGHLVLIIHETVIDTCYMALCVRRIITVPLVGEAAFVVVHAVFWP